MSAVAHTAPGSAGLHHPQGALHTMRLQEATAQPWRNGGGVTRELLAWPAPRLADTPEGPQVQATDWAVRVSVADITQDGPFSAFRGIDRCFAVLEGDGVVLTLRGEDLHLTPDSDRLAFDGAQAPGCRLINGPTRDLNLMVRHSAGRAWMQRAVAGQSWPSPVPLQQAPDAQPLHPPVMGSQMKGEGWAWKGLYTHGPACVDTPGGRLELQPGTLLWSDAESGHPPEDDLTAPWCLVAGRQAWWLGLQAPGPKEERT
ncbi:MAG: HutD family protein [Rubrivivax sp.]|nr:HutD family protein [Rubrivivax sp.]